MLIKMLIKKNKIPGIACRVAASSNKALNWIFTPLRSVKTSELCVGQQRTVR